MLSVILLGYEVRGADDGSRRNELVLRSLASLVEGAVDGLIADVALVGPRAPGSARSPTRPAASWSRTTRPPKGPPRRWRGRGSPMCFFSLQVTP